MDPEDGDIIEQKEQNSSFLEDSSFVEIFEAAKFDKGLHELSEIKPDNEEEDYENPMDRAQIGLEETSEAHVDQGDIGDFLQGYEDQSPAEPDDFRRVHKFTKPILTAEEIAQAKMETGGEEVIEVVEGRKGMQAGGPEPPMVQESAEVSKKERIDFEENQVYSDGWRCSACWEQGEKNTLQSYCELF
jgi:hypothetical protein